MIGGLCTMAKLVVLQEGLALEHALAEADTLIGRSPECQLVLNSNMVSRRHGRVFKQDGQYFIEDLGSGNGTLLNGRKIDEATQLTHGDRIKLGPILVRFDSVVAAPRTVEQTRSMARPAGAAALESADESVETDDDPATIMGTSAPAMRFGQLEVKPEAKLKAVLEISRSLAGTVNPDDILPRMLDTLFRIFPHADRACVLMKHPETGRMAPRAIKHRRSDEDESVKISRTILKTVLEQKTGVLSADAASDSRFQASESISNLTIRSMMCVPLLSLDNEPLGVINIDTQNAFNQFQPEDLDLLMAVAGQAAMSFESAMLMASHLAKQKQDEEMRIAANVQRALLPEQLPTVGGYQFYASYDSAQAVGGDYYDCFSLEDGRVCMAFGDVAGKGVPASLLMSRISTIVSNTVVYLSDVGEAVRRINDQMCSRAVEGRFVTFVLVMLDVRSGDMTIVNAGHMPLMIRKPDGAVVEVADGDAVGLPLGVIEGFEYDVVRRRLEPGEVAVIYTDGVSEAMDPDGDLYGVDRLRELVLASRDGAAEELGQQILADVRKHANGRAQNDDITIMVFGRTLES